LIEDERLCTNTSERNITTWSFPFNSERDLFVSPEKYRNRKRGQQNIEQKKGKEILQLKLNTNN